MANMKKWILVLLAFLGISLSVIYLSIPSNLSITSIASVNTTDVGTERFLIDESKWPLWWYDSAVANKKIPEGNIYSRNGFDFSISNKFYKSVDIDITRNDLHISSKLVILPYTLDSTGLQWTCSIPTSNNPITKINTYLGAKELKKNMDTVLRNMVQFLSKLENVYGIPIVRDRLKDTLYVTAKKTFTTKPGIKEVYGLIANIQQYVTKNGATQSGSPIFNITEMDSSHFQLMAGIPVNNQLKEAEGFAMKYMVKGSFMISEVVGGDAAIKKASQSLQQYFIDFRRTSMAMNFTMLVTDRMLQPDSSKWITKLYQPVY